MRETAGKQNDNRELLCESKMEKKVTATRLSGMVGGVQTGVADPFNHFGSLFASEVMLAWFRVLFGGETEAALWADLIGDHI
ncbi:hypothetical protein L1887_15194 [Cichorium endivia]|nr:hypothetical protein L1887_15194 [Cichorium endivia]